MTTATLHHACVRVGDIENGARFYIEAFEGRLLTRPFILDGAVAEETTGGPPGVRFKLCHIGLTRGAVELFEFLAPVHEVQTVHPSRGNVIHFALQVVDVAESLRRVEAAGGRRLWAEVSEWETAHFMYVADPYDNVIELLDASSQRIAQITSAAYPEARVGDDHLV